MKKILLTGFETFASHQKNLTESIAKNLHQKVFTNYTIQGEVLPVSYQKVPAQIAQILTNTNPSLIVATGIAKDRKKISIELVALNYMHASIADNDGVLKQFESLAPSESEAIFSTLPIKELLNFCQENEIDAELSSSAGTYICNLSMFYFLKWATAQSSQIPCGFIHYPADMNENQAISDTIKILEFLSSFNANL